MNSNSYDLSKVNDRIQYFQDEILKVTANRFAKEVGIAYGTLRNLYSEDKKPRKSTITKILGAYDGFVNPNWLQSGKGKPTLSATQEHPAFQAMTSSEYWPKVGKQVRKLIRKSDKSPEEIAQATGYTIYRLNKTLSGKQTPTPQFMAMLLSELGVTVDQLAELSGVPVPQKEKAAKAPAAEDNGAETQQQDEAAAPQEEAAQQLSSQPVQPAQALATQPQLTGIDGDSVQELRMKIDFLTNRINYLEERLSRLAR